MKPRLQIGVIGSAGPEEYPRSGQPKSQIFTLAYRLGQLIAENNAILVTGGKGGIMAAASQGAKDVGGLTVGVVKGEKRFTANRFTDVEVVTGIVGSGGESVMVLMCDGIIGVGGGSGTLQELTIAYYNKIPTVLIDSQNGWSKVLAGKYLDTRKKIRFGSAKTPEKAVKMLMTLVKNG